jgi:Flp pilus assembly protein TadG
MTHGLRRLLRDRHAASGVEFALVVPVFILLVFGIICFGILFGTYNGVQQLAAESARAAVAGMSATERDQLARTYIANNAGAYGFLNPAKVSIATASQSTSFQVTVTYDMADSIVFRLGNVLSAASPKIVRSAAIQNGGF